ncbi:MAG TPA: 30S ribosome-binding factor RbfA [Phototrophicaceae bacterium]|nr:30S ribosome-binding factor RbfA [Phototrophicaceae bacterium]
MGKIKQERTSGQIRKILSQLIIRDVADPRLQGITITDVELDPELLFAKVYVNALGEEERQAEVMGALNHAKGFLRREVAKRVHLRKAPELIFRWDASLERSERINALLSSLDIPPEETTVTETELEDDDDSELE